MKFWIFLISSLLCTLYAAEKAPEFLIEAAPSFVELINEEEFSNIADHESANGVHYQLLDSQIK